MLAWVKKGSPDAPVVIAMFLQHDLNTTFNSQKVLPKPTEVKAEFDKSRSAINTCSSTPFPDAVIFAGLQPDVEVEQMGVTSLIEMRVNLIYLNAVPLLPLLPANQNAESGLLGSESPIQSR